VHEGTRRDDARRRGGAALGIALALAGLLGAAPAAKKPASPPSIVAITDVTLIDPNTDDPRPHTTVLVRGGTIAQIGPASIVKVPSGARRVDGAGKFLIPGLWDMHLHLANRPDSLLAERTLAPLLVAYGVTGVRDMGGDWNRIQAIRRAIAKGAVIGPRIVACGPFVDGPQDSSPYFRIVADSAAARRAVRDLKRAGVDFIKVQSQLSEECLVAVAEESRRLSIPFVGHVPERVDALTMIATGPRSIEHVSPALPGDAGLMRAVTRDPEGLRDSLLALEQATAAPDADFDALRAMQRRIQSRHLDWQKQRFDHLAEMLRHNGIDVVPTLIWSQSFRPLDAGDSGVSVPLEYVPHALADRWRTNRRAYLGRTTRETFTLNQRMANESIEFVRDLHRKGVRLMAGTDAFDAFVLPGPALHQELELLVRAGFTPLDALRAATSEPERFFGGGPDHCGLKPGCIADLVVLDADPLADIANTRKIQAVVLRGKLLDRPALDALLQRIAQNAAAH